MAIDIPVDLATALAQRYQLTRVLGRGGMATVYLATDLKHRRDVALKVLLPGLAAFLGTERFLKEIQIAAGLTHPHILALHDSGEAGGFLYYVMPYVDGGSLRQRMQSGAPLSRDHTLAIASSSHRRPPSFSRPRGRARRRILRRAAGRRWPSATSSSPPSC